MAQITKPIALDETLQRVATACEGIKAVLAQTGEKIILKVTANGTSFPTEAVAISIKNAEDDSVIFTDDVPIGVEYTLSESIEPDTKYYISWELFSGWHSPRKEIHTATHGYVRNIVTHYEQHHIGAMICTTDRRLYSKEDWHEGLGIPLGIYFSNGTHSFIVALDDCAGSYAWGKGGSYEQTHALPEDGSRLRFNNLTWTGGKEDCDYYKENCNLDNMPAVNAAINFVWPNNSVDDNAYLASVGELGIANVNILKINEYLVFLGKEEWSLTSNTAWWCSSTQASSSNIGVSCNSVLHCDNGYGLKWKEYKVRAFAEY